MPEWKSTNPIKYGNYGYTEDEFYRKIVDNIDQLFELVNILRSAGAEAGLDATDATAYSQRINTQDNGFYIRDKDNNTWIYLGQVAENCGITAEVLGAIASNNIKNSNSGLDASKPTTGNKTNDFYYATDTFTLYRWTGSAWAIALSKKFKDILDYEQYCISRDEVAANGKDKISTSYLFKFMLKIREENLRRA